MNRLTTRIDDLFFRRRWVLHSLFWLGVMGFYVLFFRRRNSHYVQTFFFVGLLMPVAVGTTYLLNYYLVPSYLMMERYGKFLLYSVYLFTVSLFMEMMIAMLTFIVMAEVRIRDMNPSSFDLVFLLSSLLVVVFLGVAIKMILHWRQSKEEYQKLMREKVETELKFLKTQLNPHFLFNTLNNLYYLSTEKSDKAPQAILALSEILDYVLHSGKSLFVPLSSELRQVENYIKLELLRYEERVRVSTQFIGELNHHQIGPMILITLIENAFKHGVMPVAGKSWINLKVTGSENEVSISIQNSHQHSLPGNGIGLENLRNQLDHLYGENYSMNVDKNKENEFSVNLILNTR